MRPIVFITGLMRSGTSLVAAVVHRLGFQVAPYIPAPAPPSWRSDWEDPPLTTKLIRGKFVDWAMYVDYRRDLAEVTGFDGVAVKSPYLALHYDEIQEHVLHPFWIRCDRLRADVERSMLAHPQLSPVHQAKIERALDRFMPDLTIQYEQAIAEPFTVTMMIAEAIDSSIDDPDDAADLIGSPTEYAPCPR